MRVGGGVIVTRGGAAVSAPPLLLLRRQYGKTISCAFSPSASSSIATDHLLFINDVARMKPPENLPFLLSMLQIRGEIINSPGARKGLLPFIIPLSEGLSGHLTALLRWPTAPPGMEMPVVEVHRHGVWLLAKNVDSYIHRILAEEDSCSQEICQKVWETSSDAGRKLYRQGDFAESHIADLDTYLLKKVGLFPDVIERKATRHLEKGDYVSALVTGEFYTKNHFPGFGRPFVFNADVLMKVGRNQEAKDAARAALKSPWWTLGCKYQDVADIAQWDDEQIEYLKEKVSEEGKKEDLKKGKAPAQVALDEAAFLLDLASIEGTWNEVKGRISQCYAEAGLPDIANFVLYGD